MQHDGVLAWVNQVREQYKIGGPLDDLPLGRPDSSHNCPIARALHAECTTSRSSVGIDGRCWFRAGIMHPESVTQFIKDFDAGLHPDLIEAP
jgi:hypothetical protein